MYTARLDIKLGVFLNKVVNTTKLKIWRLEAYSANPSPAYPRSLNKGSTLDLPGAFTPRIHSSFMCLILHNLLEKPRVHADFQTHGFFS